jgi:hypothetical protein
MECSFYFEVVAPNGLGAIKPQIESGNFGLYVYQSGFKIDSKIELGMDTITTDVMNGSGYIESSFQEAKDMMRKLSEIFKSVEYPHKIGVDDGDGENTVWYIHNFS